MNLLLCKQAHRETGRFFAVSGVQLAQTDRGQFHCRRAAFSSHLKSRVGNILAKAVTGCCFTHYALFRRGTYNFAQVSQNTLVHHTRKLLVY